MIRPLCFSILLALVAASASAGELMVHDAWVREPPPGNNAAAYLVLHNATDAAVHVVAASSPAAAKVELHESVVEDEVARMKRVERLEVPAGGRVAFEPGGLHLMLIEPKSLKEGATVSIELALEGGASLSFDAPVRKGMGGHGAKHGEGHAH